MTSMILLRGLGASHGVIEGRVCIVTDVTKHIDLKEGYILVVPYTTPLQTLMIANAQGLVTDIGGLTSHSAIIARELGIPCIVNTQNATKVLKDGDHIKIDGGKGIIYGK